MAQARSNVVRFLTITMTQGGADAFVQGTVDTGILASEGRGLQVVGMDFSLLESQGPLSADADISWSLTRATKTAVVGLSDEDAIIFDRLSFALTTSGTYQVRGLYRYEALAGIYIVEPTLYGQLDSTATGIVQTGYWRIYYQEVALSEVDILRILNNS